MTITGINEVMSKNDINEINTNELGKNDFLNLLVAQLENQDPLNPMDSTDFTAQLAQFSALEQMTNVNTNLKTMIEYQNTINNSQVVDFIGKSIKTSGNSVEIGDGNSANLLFDIESDASQVIITIYDKVGGIANILECGSMGAGSKKIIWNGTDLYGNKIADGIYNFVVNAKGFDGNAVETKTYSESKINSIIFNEGKPYLVTGNMEFSLEDVKEIFK